MTRTQLLSIRGASATKESFRTTKKNDASHKSSKTSDITALFFRNPPPRPLHETHLLHFAAPPAPYQLLKKQLLIARLMVMVQHFTVQHVTAQQSSSAVEGVPLTCHLQAPPGLHRGLPLHRRPVSWPSSTAAKKKSRHDFIAKRRRLTQNHRKAQNTNTQSCLKREHSGLSPTDRRYKVEGQSSALQRVIRHQAAIMAKRLTTAPFVFCAVL